MGRKDTGTCRSPEPWQVWPPRDAPHAQARVRGRAALRPEVTDMTRCSVSSCQADLFLPLGRTAQAHGAEKVLALWDWVTVTGGDPHGP